jgi:hypothetical protein
MMPDNGDTDSVVNSVMAEALKAAGVPPREIKLEEPTPPAPSDNQTLPRKTNMDGSLKGQIKGQLPDEADNIAPTEEEKLTEELNDQTKAQTLSKEEVAQLINQASINFQSIMDRKINALNNQMNQTVNALNQFFQTQDSASLNGLPPEEQVLKRLERLEKGGQMPAIQLQQPIQEQSSQFIQYLANIVDAVGLRIDDRRIDWAADVSDPNIGYTRFTASIKRALVEDQTKAIQEVKNNGEREISKIRKKTGVDKTSTGGASGAGLPNIDKMSPFDKLTYAFQQEEQAKKT